MRTSEAWSEDWWPARADFPARSEIDTNGKRYVSHEHQTDSVSYFTDPPRGNITDVRRVLIDAWSAPAERLTSVSRFTVNKKAQ